MKDLIFGQRVLPVSYTHLDVYKRQDIYIVTIIIKAETSNEIPAIAANNVEANLTYVLTVFKIEPTVTAPKIRLF